MQLLQEQALMVLKFEFMPVEIDLLLPEIARNAWTPPPPAAGPCGAHHTPTTDGNGGEFPRAAGGEGKVAMGRELSDVCSYALGRELSGLFCSVISERCVVKWALLYGFFHVCHWVPAPLLLRWWIFIYHLLFTWGLKIK